MKPRIKHLRGFTLLELQVAIILLAMGIAALSSLVTTQSRLYRKLRGDFKPGTTLYLTPSPDAWAKHLGTPARVSTQPLTLTAPNAIPSPANTVDITRTTLDLTNESITVSIQLAETP